MKVYEVESKLNLSSVSLGGYNSIFTAKKVFATKEKANEHYEKLYSAANTLQIGSYLNCSINELELE